MFLKQEEKSPIQNAYDKLHLYTAFNEIDTKVGERIVDTDELKVYCSETADILKKLVKEIEVIEKDEAKTASKNKFKEKLYGNDSIG